MAVDRHSTPANGLRRRTRFCRAVLLASAFLLLLSGASRAEDMKRVRIVAETLPPVELEVPSRLISHALTPPSRYRDTRLHLSFFLPVHADGATDASDFTLTRIKSDAEQHASLSRSMSEDDWIRLGRRYGISVATDLRDYDMAAAFEDRLRSIGLDETGQFEKFVYALNDGPEAPVYYRPIDTKDVWIRCPKQIDDIWKCRMQYMRANTVYVEVFMSPRYLPQWRALKSLVDDIVAVGASN